MEDQPAGDVDPRVGQRLGAYIVAARVADGSMGRVYEGRHHETRDRVAIKVLHAEVARDPVAVERFKREYEAVRELASPYIVQVFEFGATPDGLNYLIMEYLEGEELGLALRQRAPLPSARLVRIVAQLGIALDYAHTFGLIHRDLKPDNVFLCKTDGGDLVRILDFGSVKLQMDTGPKLTAFGTTLGSPYYMSPEQAAGKQDVDLRTDVFALGAIAYECVTGKIAFDAPSVAQVLMQIINAQPAPASQLRPGLPPRLDDVIDKALRKDKQRRYQSASAFATDFCEAYGLAPTLERWATMPVGELAQVVASSRPPAARAFVTSSMPAATTSAAAGAPKRSGMLLGVAAVTIALVAVVTALLLR
ncbi:MAG: serine/threonine-protein kinase [Polyangiales bacterium]